MRLFKSTIVIWSDVDMSSASIVDLANDAMQGIRTAPDRNV